MKLAVYQGPSFEGGHEEALAKIDQMAGASQAAGANMVVFPELFLPGYNQPELLVEMAQPSGGSWEARVSALAKKHACAITFGWAERDADNVYNTASVFGSDGQLLARHRKLQLFGEIERSIFEVGDEYTIFRFGDLSVAVLICYDIEFPHHVKTLADQGVDVIIVPTANPDDCPNVPKILVPARALENAIIIAYANYCGIEGDLTYSGNSIIAGPDGNLLAMAGGSETLLITDLPQSKAPKQPHLSTQKQDLRVILHP